MGQVVGDAIGHPTVGSARLIGVFHLQIAVVGG